MPHRDARDLGVDDVAGEPVGGEMIDSCERVGRSSMRQKAPTGALRPEARKRLGVRVLIKPGHGKQFGGGDDASPARPCSRTENMTTTVQPSRP
jgi:hypothetical protein